MSSATPAQQGMPVDTGSADAVDVASLARRHVRLEGELLLAQRRLDQQATQLSLAFSLPKFFVPEQPENQRLKDLCKALTLGMKVQRVLLFAIEEQSLTTIGTTRAPVCNPLSPAAAALLGESPAGFCNDPAIERLRPLASCVGLARFLWSRLTLRSGQPPALLIVGFDANRAAFQRDFDTADVVSLENLTSQMSTLAANLELVTELRKEKAELQSLRAGLVQQVEVRTAQVTSANEQLSQTLSALEERNRIIHADLDEARQFQTRILSRLPSHAGVSFASAYVPLDQVGGDVYNVSTIAPDVIRVFLADATGHGIQASLRTILIASEYERIKHAFPRPQLVLTELNQRLVELFPEGDLMTTATCFDIDLREERARLRLADAGNPPVTRISAGEATELSAPGTVLGVVPNAQFGLTEVELLSGDLLVTCSDGLTEAMNHAQQCFALDQSRGARLSRTSRNADDFLNRLLADLGHFTAGSPFKDDLTIIVAQLR